MRAGRVRGREAHRRYQVRAERPSQLCVSVSQGLIYEPSSQLFYFWHKRKKLLLQTLKLSTLVVVYSLGHV